MTDTVPSDDQRNEHRDIRTAMAQERMAAVGIDEASIETLVRTF